MSIRCGNHRGETIYHASVADVRACHGVPGSVVPATPDRPVAPGSGPLRHIEEGMWYIGNRIIKVQRAVHGSQHLYTKELFEDAEHNWKFDRLYGGMKELRNAPDVRRMTVEEAAEFGKLYGICCRCARTLTDETSIELGIGPICREKI